MNNNITAGCVVVSEFVTPDSSVFSGYIDYIDRDQAVRNEHIADFSIYTDYMDNPEKTTDLFTAYSDHLSTQEKQNYKKLYQKAQDNGSPMWQTVISFDNRWLEEHGLYDSDSGYLSVKTLKSYTRSAIEKMLKPEGLENAVWTAAFHYNTDNLHIHIATVEPTPTRKKVPVKTIRFPADWVAEHEIIRNETITPDKKVAAHKEKNYGYRNIHNRITDILSEQGYNTRLLGDYITIHSNGSIDLSYRGDSNLIPEMAALIDNHIEYKGTFKQSSIDKCRSKMVNQIIDHALENTRLNEVMRDNIAASMKGNTLFEDRDIIRQFLYVYKNLPEQRNNWKYKVNKIAHLRPEIDKITDMYLSKYKADEHKQFKKLAANQAQLYQEAYGGNAGKKRIQNKTKELYERCGNAILEQMKTMNLRDIRELESSSYIAAEVEEAAITGESIDFDGKISYKAESSKYWTYAFKEAKVNLTDALKLEDGDEKTALLAHVLSVFISEAEGGNSVAAYELGRCYKMGTFGDIDLKLSEEYYKLAFIGFTEEIDEESYLKNLIAMDDLKIFRQFYSPKELEKEIKRLNIKAERDEWMQDYLHYKVGRMLIAGEGTEKNIQEGISHLEKSTSPYACFTLGNLYYYGDDISQDYEKAYEYFSLAGFPEPGQRAMPFAVYNMAQMLEKDLIKEDRFDKEYLYGKAFAEFKASEAEEPNDLIEYKIATMLLEGKGCAVDEEAAEEYLLQSAIYGNTYAQTKLANLYIKSENPALAGKAVFLLQLASDSGNELAQYQLGRIYTDKTTEYYDLQKGIDLLEKSSEQGNAFAQYRLGKIYSDEEYGVKDIYQALINFTASAEQGNEFAQYQLGMIYYRGDDTEQNAGLAIHYLNQSAEQGNQFAQYTLGVIYLKGEICTPDINKAIDFFERSAERNNQFAQYQLGKIYYFGADGVEPDMEKAIDYLNLSAEQGNEYAVALLNWKPSIYTGFYHGHPSFSETMVSISSDMRQLFERLSNEHDHMLNQMIYQKIERERVKEDMQMQQ